ncbi:MAG: endonuclease [Bacilli bacterium]|jgi:endonuclease I|nr:endonuclease [Bacilli bacterium]
MIKNNKIISKIFLLLVVLLSSCTPDNNPSLSDTDTTTDPSLTDSVTDSTDSATDSTDSSTDSTSDSITNTTTGPDYVGNHYSMPEKYNSYYNKLSSSPTKNDLKTLINQRTQRSYNYVRDNMAETDRDWNLSPDKNDKNPYMRLFYAGYNFSASTAGKFNDFNNLWDREHIWAKSYGGAFGTSLGPGTDFHHLRACDKQNNNSWRNSRNFGDVISGQTGKDNKGYDSGKYSGGALNGVYEPLDHDKGDVARACFYMALIYPNNCKLVNSYPGTGTSLGHLDTLLKWHELDPVDEFEMNRNNFIYDNHQYNRNPFIDHPEWAHLGYF